MPNTNDFNVGYQPTLSPASITAAQLEQLVNAATPSSDRGLVIVTTDDNSGNPNVPNAISTVAWKRYIWLRISSASVTAYVWNPAASPGSLSQWVSISQASIPPGSIKGSQIAPGTITSDNLLSTNNGGGIPSSYITGGVNRDWLTSDKGDGLLMTSISPLYGAITGTVDKTTFGAQVVSGSNTAGAGNILDGSIYAQQIAPNALGPNVVNNTSPFAKSVNGNVYATTNAAANNLAAIDPGGNISVPSRSLIGIPSSSNYSLSSSGSAVAAGDVLAVNSNATSGIAGYVPVRRSILTLAEPTQQTNPQIPIVAANAVGPNFYSFTNPQGSSSFGRVINQTQVAITAKSIKTAYGTGNGSYPYQVVNISNALSLSIATSGTPVSGTNVQLIPGITCTIIPSLATSTVVVTANVQLYSTGAANVVLGLFTSNTVSSTQVAVVSQYVGAAGYVNLTLKYVITGQTANTPLNFYLGFGATAGNVYVNSSDGSTTYFGQTSANSFINAIEYL